MDTFYCICMEDGKMELRNQESGKVIATCRSTEGAATPVGKVCPGCGYVHTATESAFCPSCRQRIYSLTIFGQVMKGNTVEYQGQDLPVPAVQEEETDPFHAIVPASQQTL